MIETTTLRDGTTVLAKTTKFGLYAKTFANRTQADNAAAKAGLGWEVVKLGRPWFVAKI